MPSPTIYHDYDAWPLEHTTLRLPRLTEGQALERVRGFELIEERGTTGGLPGYTIREYRHPETGETRYLGGTFANVNFGPPVV